MIPLCVFSQATGAYDRDQWVVVDACEKVPACPLGLTEREGSVCFCKKKELVARKLCESHTVWVSACTYPQVGGQAIRSRGAVVEAIRRLLAQRG